MRSELRACWLAALPAVVWAAAAVASIPPTSPAPEADAEPDPWRIEKEGIAVELSVEPLDPKSGHELREAESVRFRFAISDTTTGEPLSALNPAAWMALLDEGEIPDPRQCVDRIEEFVGGSILDQPELDLNVYYVLALNDDATITVVDPLFGFGGTKLLALFNLPSPGEDWVLSPDQSRLFVSLPESDQIAVGETAGWQLEGSIELPRPRRLALQPDGAFLWALTADAVAVISLRDLSVTARIATPARPDDLAFSDDGQLAFVTHRDAGKVSVIDARDLRRRHVVETGPTPVSIAYSPLAGTVWVSHESDGTIVSLDGETGEIVGRIEAEPGLGQIRFAPGGRLGFAVNPRADTVSVIDSASGRIVQTGDMKRGPVEVTFTQELAYVRHLGSEIVLMIPLSEVGQEGGVVPVVDFTGGQQPFERGRRPSLANAIVRAPGATAVLVANPADRMIYYYKEGMAAPMGGFRNYDREPRAVLVVDRSLQERRQNGVYETAAKLRRPGRYAVAFYLDTPRITHCFEAEVVADPELERRRAELAPPRVESRVASSTVRVGEPVPVRFRITDPQTGEPELGLADVQIRTYRSDSWHRQQWAREVGDGTYEASFVLPSAGVYWVVVECLSKRLPFHVSPPLVLQAVPAPVSGEGSRGQGP